MKRIATTLKYGTLLCSVCFAACVLLQIFARLVLPTAPSWTEEAARIFFVIAIGCSAGLAFRSGDYVHFDFFYQRMNARWQQRLTLFIDLLTVILFAVFTVYAMQLTVMGWGERSPSLKIPMAIPFAGMLILGFSILVYAIFRFSKDIFSLRQNLTSKVDAK